MALKDFMGREDTYFTLGRFQGKSHRVAALKELGTLFVDLDYYRLPELAERNPLSVLELVSYGLEDSGLPCPSFTIHTGRGLALLWLHSKIAMSDLPRWNEAQLALATALAPYGADVAARDAAKLVRLIGSLNAKSNRLVEAIAGPDVVWDFDILADEIVPDLQSAAKPRVTLANHTTKPKPSRSPTRFTCATLAQARLDDLQTLLNLRHMQALPTGQRDAWLFIAVSQMAWLVEAKKLQREAIWLARIATAGSWSEGEAKSRLSSVIGRARAAAQGTMVEYGGEFVSPRYRLSNSRIIELLGITIEEQEQLRTIVGEEVRRKRRRADQFRRRRENGVVSMQEIRELAETRRQEAVAYRQDGWSLAQIAQELNISREGVRKMLVRGEKALRYSQFPMQSPLEPPTIQGFTELTPIAA